MNTTNLKLNRQEFVGFIKCLLQERNNRLKEENVDYESDISDENLQNLPLFEILENTNLSSYDFWGYTSKNIKEPPNYHHNSLRKLMERKLGDLGDIEEYERGITRNLYNKCKTYIKDKNKPTFSFRQKEHIRLYLNFLDVANEKELKTKIVQNFPPTILEKQQENNVSTSKSLLHFRCYFYDIEDEKYNTGTVTFNPNNSRITIKSRYIHTGTYAVGDGACIYITTESTDKKGALFIILRVGRDTENTLSRYEVFFGTYNTVNSKEFPACGIIAFEKIVNPEEIDNLPEREELKSLIEGKEFVWNKPISSIEQIYQDESLLAKFQKWQERNELLKDNFSGEYDAYYIHSSEGYVRKSFLRIERNGKIELKSSNGSLYTGSADLMDGNILCALLAKNYGAFYLLLEQKAPIGKYLHGTYMGTYSNQIVGGRMFFSPRCKPISYSQKIESIPIYNQGTKEHSDEYKKLITELSGFYDYITRVASPHFDNLEILRLKDSDEFEDTSKGLLYFQSAVYYAAVRKDYDNALKQFNQAIRYGFNDGELINKECSENGCFQSIAMEIRSVYLRGNT